MGNTSEALEALQRKRDRFQGCTHGGLSDRVNRTEGLVAESITTIDLDTRGQDRELQDATLVDLDQTSHSLAGNPASPAARTPPQQLEGFSCHYPGCTAAPFQTQYLLQ